MSVDSSLKSKSTLQRHRNVLSRAERIAHLREVGLWTEGKATGLPKVAHRKASVGKKDKAEKKAEGAPGAAGAEGAAAAPSAEGAKPAAGAKGAAAPAKGAAPAAKPPAKGKG